MLFAYTNQQDSSHFILSPCVGYLLASKNAHIYFMNNLVNSVGFESLVVPVSLRIFKISAVSVFKVP